MAELMANGTRQLLMPLIRILPALAVLSTSLCALAASDVEKAVAAFDQAEDFMKKGQIAEACGRYEESYRLDPQLGALLHLADCQERLGKLASAWKSFDEAHRVASQKKDERASLARKRADELSSRLSRVRFTVQEPSSDLNVRLDGAPLDADSLSGAIAVDPGEHTIVATAPGKLEWKTTVTIGDSAEERTVEIPALAETRAEQGAATSVASADQGVDGGGTGSFQRVAGWTAVAAGAVGIGLGGYFFLRHSSKKSDAEETAQAFEDLCDQEVPDPLCTEDYEAETNADLDQLAEEQRSAQRNGIILTAVGAAVLTTGIVLVLTAPTESKSEVALSPAVGPGFQMMTLRGNFD